MLWMSAGLAGSADGTAVWESSRMKATQMMNISARRQPFMGRRIVPLRRLNLRPLSRITPVSVERLGWWGVERERLNQKVCIRFASWRTMRFGDMLIDGLPSESIESNRLRPNPSKSAYLQGQIIQEYPRIADCPWTRTCPRENKT